MSNLSITVFVILTAFSGMSGCRTHYSQTSAPNSTKPENNQVAVSTPITVEDRSSRQSEKSVRISSITIHGWWWSDEQLSSNFDADNPPPKESYMSLNKWDASQPDSPHPDRIDINCRLENRTTGPVDLSLAAVADLKVASYQAIAQGAGNQNAVDERLSEIQWTDHQKLGGKLRVSLLAGEAREITFKDVDVHSIIFRYFKPSAGDLWPWKLRISTIAEDSNGARIASSEAIIDLVPGG